MSYIECWTNNEASVDKNKETSIFMNVLPMRLWFRYWRTHVWLQDTDGRYDADISKVELCAHGCIYVSIGGNVSYNCI